MLLVEARGQRMSRMRTRWLGAAVVVLSAASCTAGGSVSLGGGSTAGWLTYVQPPGPMRLTFGYPATWSASGRTLISSMGGAGIAQVTGDTSSTIAQFNRANCRGLVRLLHGSGVFVEWSAELGSPRPMRLSEMPGRRVRVNDRPARLAETTSSVCGRERLIDGVIQVGPRVFLYMSADVGARAKPAAAAQVRKIFFSARP
jgi:hypothetical protein